MQADRLNMETNTAWDCGTPRSTHTVFTWAKVLSAPLAKAKRGPKRTKAERAAIALDTDEERLARVQAANQARKTEMLRFKGDVHNFGAIKTPAKRIRHATGAMRTI